MRNEAEAGGDDPAIARLLEQLYQVISFEEGGEPDWSGLQALFSPHARITRITCISAFPAVPMNKPSVRLTISRHNSYDHIRELVASLGDLVPVTAQAPPPAVPNGATRLEDESGSRAS